ncbi:ABC-type glycerol-3-phosphate transport system substrate-binding protein [Kribbella aluminosa]|uniref:ABC-type glycerol-3-phosphate transport system substrate-binding protein n=1 Tax=Kribbella aluminosa TaxID=416017 RepID=A0ABS4UIV2_9ACTN|nr:extracellular solute-binding protein [Kribbella aluminosa]MBP2351588.1 ABC-type glycerol-3-phosphate transport system substrate-binding protein [Kribbella aluminosa]
MKVLPRRRCLTVLVVAGTALLAGACGFGGPNSPAAGSNAPIPDTLSKKTTISFWHVYTGADGAAIDGLVKKFEAANPNVTVQAQYVGGFNDLNKKVVSSLQAGSPPDVTVAYPPNVLEYVKSKRVVDLTPYVDKAGAGLSKQDLADILPNELKRNRYSTQGGAYLSFPFAVNVAVLYYNADLLAKAGFNAPPKTWADFERVCAAVKALGRTCYSANANASTLNAIGYSYGTSPVAADGKASFGTAQWKDAFGLLGRLTGSGTTRLASTGDAQTVDQNEFVSGQAAFIIRSSRTAPFLSKAIGDKFAWNAAALPQATATARPTTALYGPGLAAFASDPDRQLASWQLIKFLGSADTQSTWAKSTGNLPIRRSVVTAPAYAAYLKQHPATAVSASLVADAHWEGALGDQGIVAFLPQKLRNSMEDLEGGILSGALTPDAAQSQLQAQATRLMAAR